MSSTDEWAKPLADELVSEFRVNSLDYVRSTTAYDPATGEVTTVDVTIPAAGAVLKMSNLNEGGVAGPQELIAWVDLTTLNNIWPTAGDYLTYEGKTWKLITIAPAYAGDLRYAAKLTARSS